MASLALPAQQHECRGDLHPQPRRQAGPGGRDEICRRHGPCNLDDPSLDGRPKTYQGPVAAGDYIDIGTFEDILGRAGWQALPDHRRSRSRPIELELTVIATYRSEDLIVGATRCFELEENDAGTDDTGWTIKARTADTRQIRSKTERKALHKAYTDYLD